jgi:hypothetical protein
MGLGDIMTYAAQTSAYLATLSDGAVEAISVAIAVAATFLAW